MPKKDEVKTDERKAERADQQVRATEEQRGDEAVGMSEEAREAAEHHIERNKEALTELAKW